jgi:nicotinate phosphoribosyltransferase
MLNQTTPEQALAEARAHHGRVRAALPAEAWALSRGECALDIQQS